MKEKKPKIFMKLNDSIKNKKFIYISSIIILAFFSLTMNIAFSAFTSRHERLVANIEVQNMAYRILIDGKPGINLTVSGNKTTIANLIINSLNNLDTKYELVYKVCSTSTCNTYIEKPESLIAEYSSKTIDSISGTITSNGTKQIRIAVTNTNATTYYIELGINAERTDKTIVLKNLINTKYNEDVTIAAIIDGEISTTFPTVQGNYKATVTCRTNGGTSNASGSATWNGTKWVLNITGADSGKTICNVYFELPLKDKILAQGGGASAISAKGNPNFSQVATLADTGLYSAADEYGTSYYYRGLKTELNNNLLWGGFQWKIVRINGDGSIRILYNGTEAQFNSSGEVNSTGANINIGSTAFANNNGDPKYLGYMYGGMLGVNSTSRNGTTSGAATYNQNGSNIKTALDNWYQTNISGKSIESQVVNNLFCNDRQLRNEVGGEATGPGYGSSENYYATYHYLITNKTPTLKCGLKNDRFTTNTDTVIGNGSLTYPIGLLTANEISMAGLVYYPSASTANYLHIGFSWWTLSPNHTSSSGTGYLCLAHSSGYLYYITVGQSHFVRPSVSINSEVLVTGNGTATNPYIALPV